MNFLTENCCCFFSPLCVSFQGLLSFCTEFYYVSVPVCFPEEHVSKSHSERQATRDLTALAGHQAVANILQQGRQNNKSLSCKFGSSFRCKTNLFK